MAVGSIPIEPPSYMFFDDQLFRDNVVASVPGVGNLVGGFLSVLDFGGGGGDTIATFGGQLGAEAGAINIPSTYAHEDAGMMFGQAKNHLYYLEDKASLIRKRGQA